MKKMHSLAYTEEANKKKSHKGSKHPKYKPLFSKRKHTASDGFIYYLIKISDPDVWEYEHRYILECRIGRKLLREEHVHHINKNTLDNREENLLLLTASEHTRLHHKGENYGTI